MAGTSFEPAGPDRASARERHLTTVVRRYSDAELVGILRNGLHPDGTSVFVMPSECFTWLTDEDRRTCRSCTHCSR